MLQVAGSSPCIRQNRCQPIMLCHYQKHPKSRCSLKTYIAFLAPEVPPVHVSCPALNTTLAFHYAARTPKEVILEPASAFRKHGSDRKAIGRLRKKSRRPYIPGSPPRQGDISNEAIDKPKPLCSINVECKSRRIRPITLHV